MPHVCSYISAKRDMADIPLAEPANTSFVFFILLYEPFKIPNFINATTSRSSRSNNYFYK